MPPDLTWDNIPYELLLNIYRELSYRDLVSCGAVSVHWRHVMRDKTLWKQHLRGVYAWWNWEPLVTTTHYDEFMFFKRNIPKFLKEVVNDYDYDLRQCIFSPYGGFFIVCGKGAHFCIYRSDPLEFLHERCLKDSLNWQEITTSQFSPDESKVMLTGVRQDGSGELAVFSIDSTGEVHFICRSPCSPPGVACWFDNDYLICGEVYQFGFSSAIASSISQLWLMSVPKDRKDALTGVLCPILRFLNREGKLRFPLISNYVSSRFRRVLQLTQEADMEHKTLEEKLAELELCASNADDLSELRRVLDAQQQCFDCYLKHSNGVERSESAANCICFCHEILLKMLIFVNGDNSNRVCFKLIDHNLFSEALAMKRFTKIEQEGEEDDGWNFVLRRVDTPDHYIEVDGVITNITLSVDKKQLFVSYETRAFASTTKYSVYCVDLEKMVLDKFPFSGAMLSNEQSFLCSNEFLLASAVGEEVHIWARLHGGNEVQKLAVDTRIVDLSLHPTNNTLITASQNYLAVWSTTQPEIMPS